MSETTQEATAIKGEVTSAESEEDYLNAVTFDFLSWLEEKGIGLNLSSNESE